MKTRCLGAVALGLLVLIAGCDGLFDGNSPAPKGLVTFYSSPRYDQATEEIYFAADMQYDDYERHSAVDIDYQILDGTSVVYSGTAAADTYDDYGRYWKTGEIRVPLSRASYASKEITVFLDPEGELVSEQWEMLESERRKSVTIP